MVDKTGIAVSDVLRKRFEEKVFSAHFFANVKFKEGQQFADCSGQMPMDELCEREGDDYKRQEISAMWFGYKMGLAESQGRI